MLQGILRESQQDSLQFALLKYLLLLEGSNLNFQLSEAERSRAAQQAQLIKKQLAIGPEVTDVKQVLERLNK